jgi:undecaprenyl-diphosphatase
MIFLNILRHFDQQAFLAIYYFVDNNFWLESFAFYIARYGIVIYFLVLALLFWWPVKGQQQYRNKKAVVYVLICLAIAFLVDEMANLLKTRHRPFVSFPEEVAKLNVIQDLTSFPSTHTIFVFAMAVSLWLSEYRKIALPLIIFAFVLGFSRIAVGVHYPFDILGGIVLGVVIPILIHYQGGWFKEKLLNHRDLF